MYFTKGWPHEYSKSIRVVIFFVILIDFFIPTNIYLIIKEG